MKRILACLLVLGTTSWALWIGDDVKLWVDLEGPVWVGSDGWIRYGARLERSVDGGPWEPAERVENLEGTRVVLYRAVSS